MYLETIYSTLHSKGHLQSKKHHEKKKLVKEMKGIAQQLKLSLNIIIYNVVIHQINKSIKSNSEDDLWNVRSNI